MTEKTEEGREAFMQWLNSDDKKPADNPIFLKQFVNGKQALLYDSFLNKDYLLLVIFREDSYLREPII
jgi:hypothetical protein